LDETAYFSAHWNKAVELFDADIFFQIQADAEFDQFKALFAKARLLFGKYELGVYEPNVEHTRIQYDKLALRPIEPDVFEVPKPDSICWFITKEVVRQLPPVDVTVNKYGFGVVSAIAALSQSSGKRCVRDYGFTVLHPKHRGYSTLLAKQQKEVYLEGLNPNLRAGTIQVDQRAFSARLRRKHRD
jgi:hypothetical protein